MENLSASPSGESVIPSATGRETKLLQHQMYPFSVYQMGHSEFYMTDDGKIREF